MVSLYQGGEYQLYQYRKYTDVRLVFAPEQSMAFFGGDPDNFTFPRHDLDICLMRAYENGKPVVPASYLRWTAKGVSDGDLVLRVRAPRLDLAARRRWPASSTCATRPWPFRLEMFKRRLAALHAYAALGEEQKRRALGQIFGYENSQKALGGYYAALLDTKAMAAKGGGGEGPAREGGGGPRPRRSRSATPGPRSSGVQEKLAPRAMEARLVGFGGSQLLGIAGQIVQYVAEVKKPNERRYEEYVDANLDSLRNELLSPAPIHADLEVVTLTDQLQLALDKLGPEHAFVERRSTGRRRPRRRRRPSRARSSRTPRRARRSSTAGRPRLWPPRPTR